MNSYLHRQAVGFLPAFVSFTVDRKTSGGVYIFHIVPLLVFIGYYYCSPVQGNLQPPGPEHL
jgi:hypothetical protein